MTVSLLPTLENCGGDTPVAWGAISAVSMIFFTAFVPIALQQCAPESIGRKIVSFAYILMVMIIHIVRNSIIAIEDYRLWSTFPSFFHLGECLAQLELVENSVVSAATVYYLSIMLKGASRDVFGSSDVGIYCSAIGCTINFLITACAVSARAFIISIMVLAFTWPYIWVDILAIPIVYIIAISGVFGLAAISVLYGHASMKLGHGETDDEFVDMAVATLIAKSFAGAIVVVYAMLCGYYYLYGDRDQSFTSALSVRGSDHVSFAHWTLTNVYQVARIMVM